jgi:hypothetical protein
MYRIVTLTTLTIAGIAAAASPALATAPPDTTPPTPPATEAPVGTAATAELEPAGTQSVEFVDESGSPLAALTVVAIEPAWTGFAEGDEPESGHEYLRITILVESRSARGLFEVDESDFIVQDVDGFLTSANIVPTAEQTAATQEPVEEAELAEGESVELPLTFEVVSGVAPQALFFMPGTDRLVTVTNLT